MELTSLLLPALLLVMIVFWFRRADRRLPPSPRRPLPIVGHLLYMDPDFRVQFPEFRKQCGNVFSLYLGGTLVIVLNGYDVIKEALVKHGDLVADRPLFFFDSATGFPGKGILFANGHHWIEQRTVALSILKTFGMGKNRLTEKIQDEVGCFMNYLASLKGQATDIRAMLYISVANVICHILVGHRFEYNDRYLQDLMHKLHCLATDQPNVGLLNVMPWLRFVPGDLFLAKRLTSAVQNIIQMLHTLIEETRRNCEYSVEACNLIDAYLLERNKKTQAGIATELDDNSLCKIIFDLFITGTETTSTTIYWCLLYMLHNTHVQDKIHQEIKETIGLNRIPTMQDNLRLPYLNAVIAETQRLASIAPLSGPRLCSKDMTLKGYTLPKGTWVMPNLDSVLHDKAIWGQDAMSFRPERFLDNDGKLHIPEQWIPFGIGRRVCLGEAMARMELFLYLSFMFQRFHFLPSSPGKLPELKYKLGITCSPQSYEITIVERK